jgi:hypothetical protein
MDSVHTYVSATDVKHLAFSCNTLTALESIGIMYDTTTSTRISKKWRLVNTIRQKSLSLILKADRNLHLLSRSRKNHDMYANMNWKFRVNNLLIYTKAETNWFYGYEGHWTMVVILISCQRSGDIIAYATRMLQEESLWDCHTACIKEPISAELDNLLENIFYLRAFFV